MAEIYKNDWFSVRKEGRLHIIDQKRKDAGSAVIPIDAIGNVVLVRQHRAALQRDLWEAPRGFSEDGESMLACAMRELNEETGLKSENMLFTSLGQMSPDSGLLSTEVSLFAATASSGFDFASRIDSSEINEVRIFSPAEQRAILIDGSLIDSFTLSLMIKAYAHGLLSSL